MSNAARPAETNDIVVDEVFPQSAGPIWRALTSGALMARWIMSPSGFEPVEGCEFAFQTTPAGAWDGTIRCRILEVRPQDRLAYTWQGGHEDNVGYGSKLDTVVTWTLSAESAGTRLRLVHSGFKLPQNASALKSLGEGWLKVSKRLRATVDDEDANSADLTHATMEPSS